MVPGPGRPGNFYGKKSPRIRHEKARSLMDRASGPHCPPDGRRPCGLAFVDGWVVIRVVLVWLGLMRRGARRAGMGDGAELARGSRPAPCDNHQEASAFGDHLVIETMGWGAELRKAAPGAMASMGSVSMNPGAPWAVHRVIRWGTWKPQIGTRLLEQGPAVSALLEPDWVACRPSLVPPGSMGPLLPHPGSKAIGIPA